MLLLILGLILFLGTHSVAIVSADQRNAMAERMGLGAWKGIYSLVSAVGLLLIIYGYGQARLSPIVIYAPPAWLSHVTALLMIPVFPMLLAAYLPGRISATLKHPMLVATKLWATAHLLANGMLADILLFGSFLAWAVVDRISLKRRPPRAHPDLGRRSYNDLIAVVLGLVIYVLFVSWLHKVLIGVAPIRMG